MAQLASWIEQYRLKVSPAVWEMVIRSLKTFDQSVTDVESKQDIETAELDEVLCPELFIDGYLNIMADLEGLEWQEEELDIRDRYVRVSREVGTRVHKKLLTDLNFIYNMDAETAADMDTLSEWYGRRLMKSLNRGIDPDFKQELMRLFTGKEEEKGPADAGKVLEFCVYYLKRLINDDVIEEPDGEDVYERLFRKYSRLRKELCETVVSQENAVRKFVQGLFSGELRNQQKRNAPQNTFLFVGPPGVGKTFLAKTAAEMLDRPVKVFQMNEYADSSNFHGLIGFESSWKSAKAGDLTSYVEKNPNAILIFDEIEKAHVNTTRLFLSILEGGTLLDLYSQNNVDFTDTILIFTTNAGRKFYEEKRDEKLSALTEETLLDALNNEKYNEAGGKMPSEILSRMAKGNIIGFDHMNPAKLLPIIRAGMKRGVEIIRQTIDIECDFDEKILPYVFLYHMGARLDARVASARSESFIKDAFYIMAERREEHEKKKRSAKKERISRAHFTVEKGEALVRELTVSPRKSNVILVCNQSDHDHYLNPTRRNHYREFFVYAENEDRDYKKYIEKQLQTEEVDAILVDPFMREFNSKEKGSGSIEGLVHKDTMGMRVIKWLSKQRGLPPVYCLELSRDRRIDFSDLQDLQNQGVRDVLRLWQNKNPQEAVDDLMQELFLASKLDSLVSKGKAVEFDTGFKPYSKGGLTEYDICIHNLRYVQSMEPEAQEIFISDDMKKSLDFNSVIGQKAAKEELSGFLKFIRDPVAYRKSGQQISRGILLYGPPGTGKTRIARAFACEADCPFIAVTGTDFLNGNKTIRDVFSIARKYAPSIVFIDEIESIAKVTGNPVVKELLTEMDGFTGRDKPVFVIAATNEADEPDVNGENIYLDPALLRRFSKKVYMRIPGRQDRIEWLHQVKKEQHGKSCNLDALSENDIEKLANLTVGRTLAVLENVMALAINRAAESGQAVTYSIVVTCLDETLYGEERKYNEDHLLVTAHHEAAHAFMGFYFNNGKDNRFIPEYASIVARGGFLGVVQPKIDETLTGYSRDELLKLIDITLAGRAAEMVLAKKRKDPDGGLTTGASGDLSYSTRVAAALIGSYGMEEGYLASFPFEVIMQSVLAKEYVDKINDILAVEMNKTVGIVEENFDQIELLASNLLERSRLDTDEMRKILHLKEKPETQKEGGKRGRKKR